MLLFINTKKAMLKCAAKLTKRTKMKDFKQIAEKIKARSDWREPLAFSIARVEQNDDGKSICASYAVLNYKSSFASAAVIINALIKNGASFDFSASEQVLELDKNALSDALSPFKSRFDEISKHANVRCIKAALDEIKANKNAKFKAVFLFEDSAPKSVESVYLKLYLLSQNFVAPREINLDGAFKILPNLAWDERGKPYELEYLRQNEIELKMQGRYPNIAFIDKFPRFLSHIVPQSDATRILDSAKVRLGAHLAGGTVVMAGASYINFNAGTLGSAMVEGRISSAVRVGEGSDIGGGASILGVLSGTNGNPISIGKRCLLGANSVTGVPLGDDCIVDAGVAVLEGTKVYISDENRQKLAKLNPSFNFKQEIYKARELAGLNGMHFRADSQSGQIICALSARAIKLNESLH